MKILVDADSFPGPAKKILLKKAIQLNIPLYYFANRDIPFPFKSPLFKMVICENKSGAADDKIVQIASSEDLAATRDIPLAARLVEKNVKTINDRGLIFSKENIGDLLKERELSLQMASLGIQTGGKNRKTYGPKEIDAFVKSLNTILN